MLSELLGPNITTATRWTDRAGSPDTGYAASERVVVRVEVVGEDYVERAGG